MGIPGLRPKSHGETLKGFLFLQRERHDPAVHVTRITQAAGGRGRARGAEWRPGALRGLLYMRACSRAPGSQHPPWLLFILLHILLAERLGNPSLALRRARRACCGVRPPRVQVAAPLLLCGPCISVSSLVKGDDERIYPPG